MFIPPGLVCPNWGKSCTASTLDIFPGVEYNRITVASATDHKKEVFFLHSDPNTLTEGSIWKKMLLFALPILLGNIFQQFYNAFDTWVVGKFIGSTALAAVSSSSSLIFMFVGFFNGVAMGAGVIIARYYGARDYKQVRIAIHTDVAFGLVAGSILTVLGSLAKLCKMSPKFEDSFLAALDILFWLP